MCKLGQTFVINPIKLDLRIPSCKNVAPSSLFRRAKKKPHFGDDDNDDEHAYSTTCNNFIPNEFHFMIYVGPLRDLVTEYDTAGYCEK